MLPDLFPDLWAQGEDGLPDRLEETGVRGVAVEAPADGDFELPSGGAGCGKAARPDP